MGTLLTTDRRIFDVSDDISIHKPPGCRSWSSITVSVLPPYAGGIFSPVEEVAGKPYKYWLARFWQLYKSPWLLRNRDPVFCVPGKLAEFEQERKERYIAAPYGKPLLFTILNWMALDQDDNRSDQEMIQECKDKIDVVAENRLRFVLNNDKVKVENQMDVAKLSSRVRSDFFEINKHKAITEGYWILTRPYTFGKGDYTIRSYGSCSSGATQVGIDYHVFIR